MATTLPDTPRFESDRLVEHLDAIDADPETRGFASALAETGVAKIDLGDEARVLCDRAVADTDRYFRKPRVNRVQDAWLRSRAVRRLAILPKVTRLLEAAFGRQPFAFQTLNFQRGTEQEIHTDAIHFHSEPQRFMCGVWTALENIEPGAGPLAYRPGSHRLPVLTMRGAGVNHDKPNLDDYLRTYVPALASRLDAAGLPTATALLKKGEALVWAANLAHGGSAVTDPSSTRRSLVTHYFFKGCHYYTPMVSAPEDGRFSTRLPVNVKTQGVVWPRGPRGLQPVRPGRIAAAAFKLAARHVIV